MRHFDASGVSTSSSIINQQELISKCLSRLKRQSSHKHDITPSEQPKMANRPIRPKPDHLHECPIFRNNRLFVGYAYGARECWFGCISEQTASREGSQRAIAWFRIWISDTSEDVLQNGVFSVEQEDPNVTRLADKDKDDPALATLGHDQRVERYGRVLDDIDRGRTKVREHENSSTCRTIDKPFILRPPPGNRGRLESDGGIRTAKKRKRRGDEEDADEAAGEPKAMRMSSMGSHFTSGLQEQEDDEDEEPHPIGQGVEVKMEENNESDQTAPDVGEREVQGEPVVPTIVEPAGIVPMNIRLMHRTYQAPPASDVILTASQSEKQSTPSF